MPTAVRMSRKFYEKLGHEVAGELVDMLNVMDAGYRADYRELLDARLAQFGAELRLEMGRLGAELRSEMDALRRELRAEMDALRRELAALEGRLHAELSVRLKSQEVRLIRWMFGLWATTMLALAGMFMALRAG